MTLYMNKVSKSIIEEHFGPVVLAVSEELQWSMKSLKDIVSTSNISVMQVKQALSVLVQYGFVIYNYSGASSAVQYRLDQEKVTCFIRYPRYLCAIEKNYGQEAKLLMEELMLSGSLYASALIIKVALRLRNATTEAPVNLANIRDVMNKLVIDKYFVAMIKIEDDSAVLRENKMPNIEVNNLVLLLEGKLNILPPDSDMYWTINYDRFHQHLRDEILIKVAERRLGTDGGLIMKHILKLAYEKSESAWAPVSPDVSLTVLKNSLSCEARSMYTLTSQLDQYIKVLEEDLSGFVRKSSDLPNSLVITMNEAIVKLAVCCLADVIQHKYGCKAARIFRLVNDKKYCELEQIQQLAMMPDKETKTLTYLLVENNFIQMRELRKPVVSQFTPNKMFVLFYVNINVVATKTLEMCYKSLYNVMQRADDEKNKESYLYDKKQKIEMMRVMSDRGGVYHDVDSLLSPAEKTVLDGVDKIVNKLHFAELQIDESILLLQLYMKHHRAINNTKTR